MGDLYIVSGQSAMLQALKRCRVPAIAFPLNRSHACSGPLPSNVSGAAANGTNFFPALRAMNISHNAFSGTLPTAFGQSGVFNLKPLQVCPAGPVCDLLNLPLCPCLSRYTELLPS